MSNIINSYNYATYLYNNNISTNELLGGRTSGHAAQLNADHAYNGSYDIDDDIYANERFFLESEVA